MNTPTKEEIAVIRAVMQVEETYITKGGIVQYKDGLGTWRECTSPNFSIDLEWRIKPREPIRFWGAVKLNDNKFPYYVHNDRGIVVNWISRMTEYAVIEFIEVIPPNENP